MNQFFAMRLFHHDTYMQDVYRTRQFAQTKLDASYVGKKQVLLHSLESPIFEGRPIAKVPVLRLYGITKRGQKACLNVHDYFPYFYCTFPEQIFNLLACTSEELSAFLRHFAQTLELSLYILINHKAGLRSPKSVAKEFGDKNEQYIHNIEVVHRYPIYGYHKDKKAFLKIELYDARNIKRCASILQKGIMLGGAAMQPYEAHLTYFMHFYGDYNLSGMEFVKITDFMIRHLDSLDEDYRQEIEQSKAFFPIRRFQDALEQERKQEQQEERKSMQSEGGIMRYFKTPVKGESKQKKVNDYTSLNHDNYLKLWHSEMPELLGGQSAEPYISPYLRVSSCEIELDCSCKDILNIWESDKNIIGGSSMNETQNHMRSSKAPQEDEAFLRDSFVQNFITPFKQADCPSGVSEERKIDQSPFQHLMALCSQQSYKTVNLEEEHILQLNNLNRQHSARERDSFAKHYSFSNQSVKGEQKQPFTPTFKDQSEAQYDNEFAPYAQDIREVRSLVNLWKEEFIRRKTTEGLPPLEQAVMEDPTRVGGYSQSILHMDVVYQKLQAHLAIKYKSVSFASVDNSLYKQLDPIDYPMLSALITQREQANNEDEGMERFQMLGFGTMRQLHQDRQDKAVMKNMQQQLGEGLDEEAAAEIDVLDIMESLKDQFESLEDKYKNYRQGKSKYKTGKLASDIVNNKSIFDYMSPRKDAPVTMQEEEQLELIDMELPLDDSVEQSYALEGLFSESEPQYSELQEALLSIQNSQVKEKLRDQNGLEEVKEVDSYMSEIASLMSSKHFEEVPPQREAAVQKESRYLLKGDKIFRVKSPRRQGTSDAKPQEAYFSKKQDLVEHLNDVRRARNDKRIQLKDLRVTFNDRVRKEIELDMLIIREGPHKLITEVADKELCFKAAPSVKSIREKYTKRAQLIEYQKKIINIENKLEADFIPAQEDKERAKKEMIEANKNPRLVTPATQYDLRFMDSQQNLGGFEKKHQAPNTNKKLNLFEIHKEFDQIYGLTVMAIEVFVQNRPGCVTNFEHDIISAVYFVVHNECAQLEYGPKYHRVNGVILNRQTSHNINHAKSGSYQPLSHVVWARNEVNLMQKVIEVFREYDPDIIVGYETETQSFGYICKRGEALTIQMQSMLSRTPVSMKPLNESFYNQRIIMKANDMVSVDDQLPTSKADPRKEKQKFGQFQQKWGQSIKLGGRVVINLWRLMTVEINLTNYDLDNLCFHILKRREPRYDYDTLTSWWQKGQFYHVSNYLLKRLHCQLDILDTLNIIHRDINMANVYGIEYESIMTRGTQFRVEAILSKISKSMGFVLLSASPEQVRNQKELEVIPLVIEPDKLFYTDPVIIVDFQSLYPSLIIAYNLCYSTCLGKLQNIDPNRLDPTRQLGVTHIPGSMKAFFGFDTDQDLTEDQLKFILDNIIVAPNLNCFVKPNIKEGLLPRMLREILYTRIMVKKSMKLYQAGSPIYRMLDSRQLALKLIANVTYGYTAAGFSGRMPCVEVSDSVVSLGRFTVENAIRYINQQEDEFGTRVIYGDTDSVFIQCQGQTLEQAFNIGEKIAKHITFINPFPMELKFEKVYYPCVTLAKKRYCGYKMEKLTDSPILDAKGIETIRRDTVDAVQKIIEKCLRLLFVKKDLSEVKDYLCRQWTKIIQGDVDFKDFIFAKEVKYGNYRSMPPGAIVVERKLMSDPGALPRYKERVPYVVVMGQGGSADQSKLKDLVLSPEEYLARDGLMLNATYYIKKQINPALNRIFLELFDIDVNKWYDRLPKRQKDQGVQSKKIGYFSHKLSSSKSVISQSKVSTTSSIAGQNSMMIDQFYKKKNCLACGSDELISQVKFLCKACVRNIPQTYFLMASRMKNAQEMLEQLNTVCLGCSNMLLKGRVAAMIDIEDTGLSVVPCVSYQCKIFYEKIAASKEYAYLREIMTKLNFHQ